VSCVLPGLMGKGKLNPEDLDGEGEGVEGGCEGVCGRGSCVVLAIFIYLLTIVRISSFRAIEE